MLVDQRQLVVIVLIRTEVITRAVVARGVVCIIHAGSEICVIKILVLVVEPERVADFLTGHKLAPGGVLYWAILK
jgi:hypothetical protein